LNGTKCSFNDCVREATERQYRPVVVRIHRVVEQCHVGCRCHGIDQGVNRSLIPTFTEVGNALDELVHRFQHVSTKKPEDR
jgi:hypothetical protein